MFLPFTCWVVGVAWARFQLRLLHIIVIIVLCVIGQTVLTPLSQVARNDVLYGSMDERLGIAMGYLSHISDLRRAAYSKEAPPDFDWRMLYYGKEQGIWDRLSMLPNDSVLVSFSDEGHYFGYKAIRYYFENWVPHIIDPHKLEGINVGGNAYMHEMGGLAEADNTTGISFSATAEAYHIDGWRAIAFVSPLIYMLLFITTDFVAGDNRRQPFGLLLTLNFAHVAPETGLGGAISATWLTNIGVILAIVVCGYIAPIFGLLLSGKRSSRAALPDRARLPRRLPESLPGSALQGS